MNMRLQSRSVVLSLSIALSQLLMSQQASTQSTPSRLTVLITATTESDTTVSASGAATKVGGVVLGSGGSSSSTYEHSEVWEVVRRFADECPAANFVTNPQTPHNLTIHTDYQKEHSSVLGTVALYQLVLLDNSNNPLYVSKKDWLRREIKPICKMIEQQQVK
jgi:hypothetical protein